jgi:hypothetical protein
MAYGIKKLWREANDAKGNKFIAKSIDHYPMHYVRVPKQKTACIFLTQKFFLIFVVCFFAFVPSNLSMATIFFASLS